MSKIILKGWKYGLFVGSIVGAIGVTCYAVIVYPMMNIEKYKKIQAETRRNIRQEEIQPGNMKVWSDPFDRKE